ncbi:hypothetical protein QUB30_15200 [Microcoleus sp. BROC3]
MTQILHHFQLASPGRKNPVSARNLVVYARLRQRETGFFWEACDRELLAFYGRAIRATAHNQTHSWLHRPKSLLSENGGIREF